MEAMQVEFNNKYQDYVSKKDTYSELIRQTKESELQEMNQSIQQFQQTADQNVQKQRTEIFKPVLDKANKAISEVAKENNFTYIFDISAGTVIYHADNSTDILPLVKLKLGLKNKIIITQFEGHPFQDGFFISTFVTLIHGQHLSEFLILVMEDSP